MEVGLYKLRQRIEQERSSCKAEGNEKQPYIPWWHEESYDHERHRTEANPAG